MMGCSSGTWTILACAWWREKRIRTAQKIIVRQRIIPSGLGVRVKGEISSWMFFR